MNREEADKKIVEFFEEPQESISKLYEVEREMVSILCRDTNPVVLNVIRKKFIEHLFLNIKDNTELLKSQAKYVDGKIGKAVIEGLENLGKELSQHEKDSKSKALYLTRLFSKYKIKTSSRLGLVPSFEYFSNAISNLQSMGIIESRPSADKRGEVAYYPRGRFYSSWDRNRKDILAKSTEGLSKGQAFVMANNKELVFYNLLGVAIGLEINDTEKNKIHTGYTPITITDVESALLMEHVGRIYAANNLRFNYRQI